jgi:hypothetical protein
MLNTGLSVALNMDAILDRFLPTVLLRRRQAADG